MFNKYHNIIILAVRFMAHITSSTSWIFKTVVSYFEYSKSNRTLNLYNSFLNNLLLTPIGTCLSPNPNGYLPATYSITGKIRFWGGKKVYKPHQHRSLLRMVRIKYPKSDSRNFFLELRTVIFNLFIRV